MKEYPIRIVSKITGLTSDQIRKWEERYPILKISRSERGSRRFTDKDGRDEFIGKNIYRLLNLVFLK